MIFLALATLAALLPPALAAPSNPSPPAQTPGPTLAVEDTMHTEVPEVLVTAPRVTLAEIIDRVARGEARRESLIVDQTFTAVVRLVRDVKGKKAPKPLHESVWRVYRKRPDKVRALPLRQWDAKPSKNDDDATIEADFDPSMGERIVNFAFRPTARRDYRYWIEGRDLVGDHVIYRIGFEPRSPLSYEPSGLVWVDTNDFVIAREEIRFDRSPVPLVFKGVDRMVVERQRIGQHWVLRRVVLRGEMTIPVPELGRSFDLLIGYDDYAMNSGIADSFFVHGSRR